MPAIHHEALLTGQLLLLEDEVDSVLTTLLNAGLDVTGLADPGPLDTILSMKGSVSEGAYRAAVGRRAILHGETIGRKMGISSWVGFAGTDDRAVVQGELLHVRWSRPLQ